MEASEAEIAATVEAFCAAWNTHDIEAIMSFFTDDAVVRVTNTPGSNRGESFSVTGAGQQQIRDMVKGFIPGYRLEYWDLRVSGNRAILQYRNSADIFRKMGLDFVEGTAELVFEGEKIKIFNSTHSPQTMQKMWDALGGQSSHP